MREGIRLMKVFITGGAGFIGSHAAEYYARSGNNVVIYDNLSRSKLFGYFSDCDQNIRYLRQYSNVKFVEGDVLDYEKLKNSLEGAELVIHAAAQTAVTASCKDPITDFSINANGTLNLLEAARQQIQPPTLIYCSTNKVYGENVNQIQLREKTTRYEFDDSAYQKGIHETFGIDLCGHSPYGCSKLSADLYMQDYARHYNLKIGVFRLSCVYGPRQFGVEDQGWLSWFAIATHMGKPIVFYGDGKQARDVLFISDLLEAFNAFVTEDIPHQVFNLGGGSQNTLSLIELVNLLQKLTSKKSQIQYSDWRLHDQKVYVTDIRKANHILGWSPKVSVEEGVQKLTEWIQANENLFSEKIICHSRTF